MSNSLSQIEMAELEELRKVFGEATDNPHVNPEGRDLAGFVAHIRGLLAEASQSDHVSVSALAERLGISKPAVSRHLRTDGDIRASTMWLLAKALNRRWEVSLVPADLGVPQAANHFVSYKMEPRTGRQDDVLSRVDLENVTDQIVSRRPNPAPLPLAVKAF